MTRTGGAPPGGYDVAVTQLASAERQTFSFVSPAADGTLAIANADGSARTSVDLKAGATVDDAVSAINGSSTSQLYAVNVNGSLVLSAKTTGDTSGFSITGAGVGTQTERVAGQNAKVTINGTDYERQSNTITDALPGLQLTLKGKTAVGATVGVTVGTPGPDKDAIVTKVKAFVTAYNDVVKTARADLTEKPVINGSTTADVQTGTLFGDSGLNMMLSQLRSTMSAPIAGLTGLTAMSDIGVSTGAANTGSTINQDSVDGLLTIDETKLRASLDANPNGRPRAARRRERHDGLRPDVRRGADQLPGQRRPAAVADPLGDLRPLGPGDQAHELRCPDGRQAGSPAEAVHGDGDRAVGQPVGRDQPVEPDLLGLVGLALKYRRKSANTEMYPLPRKRIA